MIRRAIPFLAAAAAFLVATPVTGAKEGVQARLTTAPPLDASPGETITVAWTLTYADEGRRRPFGAAEIYVRLLSASGGEPSTALASAAHGRLGRYTARIAVPEGGLAGIDIGVRGYADGVPGDFPFPIVNNPFTASARAPSDSASAYRAPDDAPVPAPREAYDATALFAVLALMSAAGLGIVAAVTVRRTRRFARRAAASS